MKNTEATEQARQQAGIDTAQPAALQPGFGTFTAVFAVGTVLLNSFIASIAARFADDPDACTNPLIKEQVAKLSAGRE